MFRVFKCFPPLGNSRKSKRTRKDYQLKTILLHDHHPIPSHQTQIIQKQQQQRQQQQQQGADIKHETETRGMSSDESTVRPKLQRPPSSVQALTRCGSVSTIYSQVSDISMSPSLFVGTASAMGISDLTDDDGKEDEEDDFEKGAVTFLPGHLRATYPPEPYLTSVVKSSSLTYPQCYKTSTTYNAPPPSRSLCRQSSVGLEYQSVRPPYRTTDAWGARIEI